MLGDDDIAEQGRDRIARSEKLARAVALGRDAAATVSKPLKRMNRAGATLP